MPVNPRFEMVPAAYLFVALYNVEKVLYTSLFFNNPFANDFEFCDPAPEKSQIVHLQHQ